MKKILFLLFLIICIPFCLYIEKIEKINRRDAELLQQNIKKYINETPVLINGIITHIIKTSKENFYDSEAIKLGIEKCINHLLLDNITKYRVAVDGIHIIEAEILPGTPEANFVFNYIKVTPEYDKDNEETCFFEDMI